MKIHLKYPDRQIDMQDEDTSKNRQIDRFEHEDLKLISPTCHNIRYMWEDSKNTFNSKSPPLHILNYYIENGKDSKWPVGGGGVFFLCLLQYFAVKSLQYYVVYISVRKTLNIFTNSTILYISTF